MSEKQNTHVDLGEDLLNADPQGPRKPSKNAVPTSVQGALKDVKILMDEQLYPQARKLCHWILGQEPNHKLARQHLQDIYELEVKRLLDGKSLRHSHWESSTDLGPYSQYPNDPTTVAEDLLRDLDDSDSLEVDTSELEETFLQQIQGDLEGTSAQGQLDLGVAFMEMGLYRVATKILTQASQHANPQQFSATLLLAQCQFRSGDLLEAILTCEGVLGSDGMTNEVRKHFFYLIGLCQEKLGKAQTALQWFQQVARIDPKYREVLSKLEGLQ